MEKSEKIDFLNLVIALLPDCIALDVKRFIASQFALESAFGTSGFACCNKNYCGMKVPSLRLTFALNFTDVGKFAEFSSFTFCIHDYLLWLQSNRFSRQELNDVSLFSKHLDYSGYCPEPGYLDRIYSIFNQYFKNE